MGTRADFYKLKEQGMEWIGSIAWDGYIEGMSEELLNAKSEEEFDELFSVHVSTREDFTSPAEGWPWPWNNSNTTDYAYLFDRKKVVCSCFGSPWFDPEDEPKDTDSMEGEPPSFPDMIERKNVQCGKKSGLVIL